MFTTTIMTMITTIMAAIVMITTTMATTITTMITTIMTIISTTMKFTFLLRGGAVKDSTRHRKAERVKEGKAREEKAKEEKVTTSFTMDGQLKAHTHHQRRAKDLKGRKEAKASHLCTVMDGRAICHFLSIAWY
jgi:hypothetical protein